MNELDDSPGFDGIRIMVMERAHLGKLIHNVSYNPTAQVLLGGSPFAKMLWVILVLWKPYECYLSAVHALNKTYEGMLVLQLPYLSGHTSGHQKLHAASDQGQQLRVPSLYCDETLSDHDTVYAENGLFHSRKGHGRGCHSWSTPKVLADITAATLSINELAPVAEKVRRTQSSLVQFTIRDQ